MISTYLLLAFLALLVVSLGCAAYAILRLKEDHEYELQSVRRKAHDAGFSKGWAQCHQAMSLRSLNAEESRLKEKKARLAMEAANARLKYYDDDHDHTEEQNADNPAGQRETMRCVFDNQDGFPSTESHPEAMHKREAVSA